MGGKEELIDLELKGVKCVSFIELKVSGVLAAAIVECSGRFYIYINERHSKAIDLELLLDPYLFNAGEKVNIVFRGSDGTDYSGQAVKLKRDSIEHAVISAQYAKYMLSMQAAAVVEAVPGEGYRDFEGYKEYVFEREEVEEEKKRSSQR